MSTTTTLKICCKHSVAIQDGPIHDGKRLICGCGDELFYSTNAGWCYRYQIVPPQLTEAEAQLVIGAIPLQALPEQPAREGEVWYQLPDENGNFDFYTDSGKRVGRATSMEFLQTIVTDHARAALVPGLVEAAERALTALRYMRDVDPQHWDYHVTSEICTAWDKLRDSITAARKAGVA